jgi:hypothetical protein
MPAFTFEKISPPARRKATPTPANEKPRGPVAQVIGRFVEVRVRRKLNSDGAAGERRALSQDEG